MMNRNFLKKVFLSNLISSIFLLGVFSSCSQGAQKSDHDDSTQEKSQKKSVEELEMEYFGMSDSAYDPMIAAYYKILPPDKCANHNYRFKVRAIYCSRYDIWIKWTTPSGKITYQKLIPNRKYSEFIGKVVLKETGEYKYRFFISKKNGTHPSIHKRSFSLKNLSLVEKALWIKTSLGIS